MKIIEINNSSAAAKMLRSSSQSAADSLVVQTRAIFDDILSGGDKAVLNYTSKFDGVALDSLRVSPDEFAKAYQQVPRSQISAIKLAKKKLAVCEQALLKSLKTITLDIDGVRIQRTVKPIQSVGCYIPGGKARYPSTLVMCAVPAKIAGVKRIVAISPPLKDGTVDPLTLVAADICGVDEFYKIGGAQGIAALSLGTESIRPVSKIVGPGGMFVTAAKLVASSRISTDMVAGPTELLVYCDKDADPNMVALDLVSQAEHSPDTMCGLVTTSRKVAEAVIERVNSITSSPELARSDIIRKSLDQNGFAAVCKDIASALEFLNEFAPEHLEVISRNAKTIADKVQSAGLVLVGENSPSSGSDYCLGSNHVLPTLGFAKSRGSLSALDFVKVINVVKASRSALAGIDKAVKELTYAEGLPNHYIAVKARLTKNIGKKVKQAN